MKQYDGYNEADAFTGEYEKLTPGGYICKILKVESEEKPYGDLLRIAFDIVEGEHEGFYKRSFENKKQFSEDAKWPGMYYQTIKQDDLRFFKGFITSLEASNNKFTWDWDEKKLVGKLFGGVFGEEEYRKNDGSIGMSCKCKSVRSVEAIKKGNFKRPDIKKLAEDNSWTAVVIDDDELPFN